MEINQHWMGLADRGFRVEVKGDRRLEQIDGSVWRQLPEDKASPHFPNGYGPLPDHELMKREIRRAVLWKAGEEYVRQDFVEVLYELKPELVR